MIFLRYFIIGQATVCVRTLVDDHVAYEALCDCKTRKFAEYLVDRLNDIAREKMQEVQASALLDSYLKG